MARCEDCIHYEVCAELENFRDPLWFINTKDEFCCSRYLHADVVPRSEVEYWKEQCFNGCLDKAIVKAAVAREIIGEILSTHTPDVDGFFTIHESELTELKKKYTEDK